MISSKEATILLLLAAFIIPNNTFLSRAIESPWKFNDFPPLLPPPSLTAVDLGFTVDECKRLIDVLVAVRSSVLVFVRIDFVFVWIFSIRLDLHSFFSFVPATFALLSMSFWLMVDTLSLHLRCIFPPSSQIRPFRRLIGPYHLLMVASSVRTLDLIPWVDSLVEWLLLRRFSS